MSEPKKAKDEKRCNKCILTYVSGKLTVEITDEKEPGKINRNEICIPEDINYSAMIDGVIYIFTEKRFLIYDSDTMIKLSESDITNCKYGNEKTIDNYLMKINTGKTKHAKINTEARYNLDDISYYDYQNVETMACDNKKCVYYESINSQMSISNSSSTQISGFSSSVSSRSSREYDIENNMCENINNTAGYAKICLGDEKNNVLDCIMVRHTTVCTCNKKKLDDYFKLSQLSTTNINHQQSIYDVNEEIKSSEDPNHNINENNEKCDSHINLNEASETYEKPYIPKLKLSNIKNKYPISSVCTDILKKCPDTSECDVNDCLDEFTKNISGNSGQKIYSPSLSFDNTSSSSNKNNSSECKSGSANNLKLSSETTSKESSENKSPSSITNSKQKMTLRGKLRKYQKDADGTSCQQSTSSRNSPSSTTSHSPTCNVSPYNTNSQSSKNSPTTTTSPSSSNSPTYGRRRTNSVTDTSETLKVVPQQRGNIKKRIMRRISNVSRDLSISPRRKNTICGDSPRHMHSHSNIIGKSENKIGEINDVKSYNHQSEVTIITHTNDNVCDKQFTHHHLNTVNVPPDQILSDDNKRNKKKSRKKRSKSEKTTNKCETNDVISRSFSDISSLKTNQSTVRHRHHEGSSKIMYGNFANENFGNENFGNENLYGEALTITQKQHEQNCVDTVDTIGTCVTKSFDCGIKDLVQNTSILQNYYENTCNGELEKKIYRFKQLREKSKNSTSQNDNSLSRVPETKIMDDNIENALDKLCDLSNTLEKYKDDVSSKRDYKRKKYSRSHNKNFNNMKICNKLTGEIKNYRQKNIRCYINESSIRCVYELGKIDEYLYKLLEISDNLDNNAVGEWCNIADDEKLCYICVDDSMIYPYSLILSYKNGKSIVIVELHLTNVIVHKFESHYTNFIDKRGKLKKSSLENYYLNTNPNIKLYNLEIKCETTMTIKRIQDVSKSITRNVNVGIVLRNKGQSSKLDILYNKNLTENWNKFITDTDILSDNGDNINWLVAPNMSKDEIRRLIGNAFCVIIFNDSDKKLNPNILNFSDMTFYYIVISRSGNGYKLRSYLSYTVKETILEKLDPNNEPKDVLINIMKNLTVLPFTPNKIFKGTEVLEHISKQINYCIQMTFKHNPSIAPFIIKPIISIVNGLVETHVNNF